MTAPDDAALGHDTSGGHGTGGRDSATAGHRATGRDFLIGRHRAIVRSGRSLAVGLRVTAEPGPGELSVAVEVAGLCGTDIQMLRGLRDDGACVIGHEGLARVVRAGPGTDIEPGTRVLVNPTHPHDPSFLLGHNVDGLFQERVLLPSAAVTGGMVLAVGEDELPEPKLAVLAEPLAVVRYALETLRRFTPGTLVVVGDGTVGHLAVRAARRWLGPARVVHVHHTAAGLAWSRQAASPADALVLADDLGRPGTPGGWAGDDAGTRAGGRAGAGRWTRAGTGDVVAVLLATPRDATVPMLDRVLAMGAGTAVVDLVGGVPPEARTPLLPGVDMAAVRAANCGGIPAVPVVRETVTGAGRRVLLFGHRGVANRHLTTAVRELRAVPGRYRELLTHESDLAGAVRHFRALAGSADRTIDGERLIKLAVHVGASAPQEGNDHDS
uniref:PrlV n=1 Tax=Nonomuraea spiralis TaxID=46182 RepID=L7SU24_9ACTN|nr:PrlV [Nonomuraea spiralis]